MHKECIRPLRYWMILRILGGVGCSEPTDIHTTDSSLNFICVFPFFFGGDELSPQSIFGFFHRYLALFHLNFQPCSFSFMFPPEPSLVLLCSARLFHLCSLFLFGVSVEAQVQRAVAVLQPAMRRWLSRVRAWRLLQDSEWHRHAFNHHHSLVKVHFLKRPIKKTCIFCIFCILFVVNV